MAGLIRRREVSSVELVEAHLEHIGRVNRDLNAVVEVLAASARAAAAKADEATRRGEASGALHGVPFSVKDSIDVAGVRTTAGTWGRRNAPAAQRDATTVARLRSAGGIPIAKTNLPDLLFSFETDNLIYGRAQNPYDLQRSPGGSSGGEAALLAACGSPLGLGSDALGSVRVPAAFCGVTSLKPTSGRLPRTGHVPPAGGWVEALWQIGPMARQVEDLELAMELLAAPDGDDFTCPPVPLLPPRHLAGLRIAFFTQNGFAECSEEVAQVVRHSARELETLGAAVEEARPPGVAEAHELELAILGADGAKGIDDYLAAEGSTQVHPFLTAFLAQMRPHATSVDGLARRWAQWDEYRRGLLRFFGRFDAVICPVYSHVAVEHGASKQDQMFRGFSYTMAWSAAGLPAGTVRCGEHDGLPVNVQVVGRAWEDMTVLSICKALEGAMGGWQAAPGL